MFQQFYGASPYIDLAILAPILFGALFAGVLAWLFIERREVFERAARLPLEDDAAPAGRRP